MSLSRLARAQHVLDAIAKLAQDRGRHIAWHLRHEEHADALGANQPSGALNLLKQSL